MFIINYLLEHWIIASVIILLILAWFLRKKLYRIGFVKTSVDFIWDNIGKFLIGLIFVVVVLFVIGLWSEYYPSSSVPDSPKKEARSPLDSTLTSLTKEVNLLKKQKQKHDTVYMVLQTTGAKINIKLDKASYDALVKKFKDADVEDDDDDE